MAGPFDLRSGEVQPQIPTNAFFAATRVNVFSQIEGRVQMTAGGSPPETSDIPAGHTVLERNFGGVLLAIQNLGNAPITVFTE